MALAQITLTGCSTYTKGGKTFRKDVAQTSTDPREIAWAKANGHFMVLDLEAEKKAVEAELAAKAAELERLKALEDQQKQAAGKGKSSGSSSKGKRRRASTDGGE